ncbi:dicarboxylate/amino acid:cation symporter [Brevundimonas vesicularis]|uniref:dicarboxylate/amino acid:cation symporter n=1 Tax=Brevundimonas vesicularis TaxID=41276 RepID=UPI0038D4F91C
MPRNLTFAILIGMLLGVVAGFFCHQALGTAGEAERVAGYFSIVSDIFLKMIKMIIAPLVFATLVAGVARMGDGRAIGRIGAKTLGWFMGASLASLALGMVLVNLLQPGRGLNLPLPTEGAGAVAAKTPDVASFLVDIVPASIVEAMATNSILQIVVFALFFGVGLAAIGDAGRPLVRAVEAITEVMLKVTGYVMLTAPFAVFAAIAAVITTEGLGVLLVFGKFIGQFYIGLGLLWALLILAGFLVLGRAIMPLMRAIRGPLMLAFSTASSEAAYPRTLERLVETGVPRRIAGFVLPLGYSFNLDGSMMYATFAILFIAQAYGIDLSLGEQIAMLLVLMVTSKGVAGVPRASLVVVAATLVQFGLPEAGLLLVLGIDQFLDMGRSATNVVGNAVAAGVIAKWEQAHTDVADQPSFVHDSAPAGEATTLASEVGVASAATPLS